MDEVEDSPEALMYDMAATLLALRGWLMMVAENHPEMDTGMIDRLVERYKRMSGEGT